MAKTIEELQQGAKAPKEMTKGASEMTAGKLSGGSLGSIGKLAGLMTAGEVVKAGSKQLENALEK